MSGSQFELDDLFDGAFANGAEVEKLAEGAMLFRCFAAAEAVAIFQTVQQIASLIRISRVLRASCDHVYPLRRGEHFKPRHPCLPAPPGHRDSAKRQLLDAGLTPEESHYRKSAVPA
jgi:hypothetical protein